jgi:phytoene dehydrogenase-like protein
LGADGPRWRQFFEPLANGFDDLIVDLFRPLVHVPRHPLRMARFGPTALLPTTALARLWRTEEAKALFAGNAAHTFYPLSRPPTAAMAALFIATGHRYGWPVVKGGSGKFADALASLLADLGGKVETGVRVRSLTELPKTDIVMFDLGPAAVADIAGDALPSRVRRAYRRFRYGSAAFKIDFAVEGGVPWTNEHCRSAGSLHVCGSFDEVVVAERATNAGKMPERPFLIVAQQYLADPSRSAGNVHPLYVYAHVPHGYTADATEAMIGQLERFAPGFRERIVGSFTRTTVEMSDYNASYIGGDINGGELSFGQFIGRPRKVLNPYRTGVPGIYICSSSTPPGPGVHGMCGHNAALSAIRHLGR